MDTPEAAAPSTPAWVRPAQWENPQRGRAPKLESVVELGETPIDLDAWARAWVRALLGPESP